MNPIQKLLSEQREEFENKFPHKIAEVVDDFGSTCKSDITDYITTAQQQLIHVMIEEINPVELAERIVIEYANISGRESENREYVRQSARTVLEKIVNNLEQDL